MRRLAASFGARLIPSLVAFAIALVGRPALADTHEGPSGLTLQWAAPSGCPTRRDALDGVVRVLGRAEVGEPLVAGVRIDDFGSEWRATLAMHTRGESSTRAVRGKSCREVTDALTVIIALAIQSESPREAPSALPPGYAPAPPPPGSAAPPAPAPAAAGTEPPATLPGEPAAPGAQPPPESPAEPTNAAPPAAPPPPEASAPPSPQPPRSASPAIAPGAPAPASSERTVQLSLGAALALDAGSLPSVGAGGDLGLHLRIRWLVLEARATLLDSGRAAAAGLSSEGASFLSVGAAAGACAWVLRTARLAFGPCARGGPEWILATGYGSQQPKNPTATVIAALFGARAAYAVTSKTSATAELDAVVPFSHPYFYIGESSGVGPRVFTVPVAAARGTFGVSVAF